MKAILKIVVSATLIVTTFGQTCDLQLLGNCLQSALTEWPSFDDTITKSTQGQLPNITSDELATLCNITSELGECVGNGLADCPREQVLPFELIMSSTAFICSTKDEFFENQLCLSDPNFINQTMSCFDIYTFSVSEIIQASETISEVCSQLDGVEPCVTSSAAAYCGSRSSEYMMAYMTSLTGPLQDLLSCQTQQILTDSSLKTTSEQPAVSESQTTPSSSQITGIPTEPLPTVSSEPTLNQPNATSEPESLNPQDATPEFEPESASFPETTPVVVGTSFRDTTTTVFEPSTAIMVESSTDEATTPKVIVSTFSTSRESSAESTTTSSTTELAATNAPMEEATSTATESATSSSMKLTTTAASELTTTSTLEPTTNINMEQTASSTMESVTTMEPTIEPTTTKTLEATTTTTMEPSTSTTMEPTTKEPSTSTTMEPTTMESSTSTTMEPSTSTTMEPTTMEPSTSTTMEPTTMEPSTSTTMEPSTSTTMEPTTMEPSTSTTMEPSTSTTMEPTTMEPSTSTTMEPSTSTTMEPTTMESSTSTTMEPSTSTTMEPTTMEPSTSTTMEPSTSTAMEPTTMEPSTSTTMEPTTMESSTSTTMEPSTSTTMEPTTIEPSTSTTMEPSTSTTMEPTTMEPTTMEPSTSTTMEPTPMEPSTSTTMEPTTMESTTMEPKTTTTMEPSTSTTMEPTTMEHFTSTNMAPMTSSTMDSTTFEIDIGSEIGCDTTVIAQCIVNSIGASPYYSQMLQASLTGVFPQLSSIELEELCMSVGALDTCLEVETQGCTGAHLLQYTSLRHTFNYVCRSGKQAFLQTAECFAEPDIVNNTQACLLEPTQEISSIVSMIASSPDFFLESQRLCSLLQTTTYCFVNAASNHCSREQALSVLRYMSNVIAPTRKFFDCLSDQITLPPVVEDMTTEWTTSEPVPTTEKTTSAEATTTEPVPSTEKATSAEATTTEPVPSTEKATSAEATTTELVPTTDGTTSAEATTPEHITTEQPMTTEDVSTTEQATTTVEPTTTDQTMTTEQDSTTEKSTTTEEIPYTTQDPFITSPEETTTASMPMDEPKLCFNCRYHGQFDFKKDDIAEKVDKYCIANGYRGFCPIDTCRCDDPDTEILVPVCEVRGLYRRVPGYKEWCERMCQQGHCNIDPCDCHMEPQRSDNQLSPLK